LIFEDLQQANVTHSVEWLTNKQTKKVSNSLMILSVSNEYV